MRSFYVLLALGIALAAIALVVRTGALARKNPGRPINSAMRQAMDPPELAKKDAEVIAQRFPAAQRSTSGLMQIIQTAGEGKTPVVGTEVAVHYEGRLLDGTVFDSSRERGRPFRFRAGVGDVIPGWDEAVLTMRPGERRTLVIPHWLAYGESARGKIPARATLVFDVELVEVR